MIHRLVLIAMFSLVMVATSASAQWIACADGSLTCTTHKVGIGNTNPFRNFVVSATGGLTTFQLSNLGSAVTCCDGFQFQHLGINTHLLNNDNGFMAFWTSGIQRATLSPAGNFGIGTAAPDYKLHVVGTVHATGNISSTGTITATYADIAEWVPSENDLKPGMVVIIAGDSDDHVNASTGRYETSVAGVVSPRPGILLGQAGQDKHMVATTGRVKVRATTQNGPIRRGDLLVTSDTPGTAMRSVPVSINGRTFHQPGTILGKALEPLESGSGEILVLLTLQ